MATNNKLSSKMINMLTDLDAYGKVMGEYRTINALKKRGLVTFQNNFIGGKHQFIHGYWPTVSAFELLDDLGKWE